MPAKSEHREIAASGILALGGLTTLSVLPGWPAFACVAFALSAWQLVAWMATARLDAPDDTSAKSGWFARSIRMLGLTLVGLNAGVGALLILRAFLGAGWT
jgi:hypothetical protein